MSDELITATRVMATVGERPVLYATFSDGDERRLFNISASDSRLFPSELVGLTEREATMLRYRRGLA